MPDNDNPRTDINLFEAFEVLRLAKRVNELEDIVKQMQSQIALLLAAMPNNNELGISPLPLQPNPWVQPHPSFPQQPSTSDPWITWTDNTCKSSIELISKALRITC